MSEKQGLQTQLKCCHDWEDDCLLSAGTLVKHRVSVSSVARNPYQHTDKTMQKLCLETLQNQIFMLFLFIKHQQQGDKERHSRLVCYWQVVAEIVSYTYRCLKLVCIRHSLGCTSCTAGLQAPRLLPRYTRGRQTKMVARRPMRVTLS